MLIYFLYRIAQWLAWNLPIRVGYRIADFFTWIKFFFAGKERTFINNNLKIILGENNPKIKKDVWCVYSNFGKYLIDFFRSGKMNKQFIDRFVKVDKLEYMDEALSRGKGAIGLTAHLGNWELCAQILGVLGYKMNAIALTHQNEKINDFFNYQRELSGIKVVPVGISVRRCFAALKRNEIVGILGDRDFSGANGIFMDFLGKQMLIPRGPAVLSLRTGAAIVPAFVVRDEQDERCFKYIFEKPIYPQKTENEEEDIKRITEQIAKVIELYVKKYPQQWFMFSEFWNPEKVEIL
ncbi:MAG: lysophospholipid acyltransferase family protein [PVC group bacterium]|nr:lysophospholipid acyltransferase family protein [PVC group bacterium]